MRQISYNAPKNLIKNQLERKKIFVKRKIKTEIFEKLLNAEKKYRNHVYNLRRF